MVRNYDPDKYDPKRRRLWYLRSLERQAESPDSSSTTPQLPEPEPVVKLEAVTEPHPSLECPEISPDVAESLLLDPQVNDSSEEDSCSCSNPYDKEDRLRIAIASWAQDHRVSQRALSDLLHILKENNNPRLPNDPRTILRNVTKQPPQLNFEANFCYFGLTPCITDIISRLSPLSLKLKFNFDGLPLYNYSKKKFWPILMSTDAEPSVVYVIGLYCDNSDPSSETLLRDLITEMNLISREERFSIPVTLDYVTCDTKALALVKGIQEPVGFYACHKCKLEGKTSTGRRTYLTTSQRRFINDNRQRLLRKSHDMDPNDNAENRTDESFRAREQPRHHKSNCLFEELVPRIDIVDCFTVDGMHCVYQNSLKRFLSFLVGDIMHTRFIAQEAIKSLVNIFGDFRFPREFTRKIPRSFEHYKLWTISELRTFLLYGADAIFSLPDPPFDPRISRCINSLSGAVRILSDPKLFSAMNDEAGSLIDDFITTACCVFGPEYATVAVHQLRHLPAECLRNGVIDGFSCFKYENVLKSIKKLCRSTKNPLTNASQALNYCNKFASRRSKFEGEKNRFISESEGFILGGLKYKPGESADSYILAKGDVMRILSVEARQSGWTLSCLRYHKKLPSFDCEREGRTISSLNYGVYIISNLSSHPEEIKPEEITRKCVVNKVRDKLVAYLLL